MKYIAIDARMIKNSGIGKVIENVLTRIVFKKSDWQFHLLGNCEILKQYSFGRAENVNLIECTSPIYSIGEQFELPLKIPGGTDVFWSPHYNVPVFYYGKLLVTIHDMAHLAMPQFVHGIHKKAYAHLMMRQAVSKSEQIITVSKFTMQEIQKYLSVEKEKIHVIYIGVDESWFHIVKKKRPYLKPYLIFVGNVKPNKNLVRLLKAFQLVMEQIPYDLVIVGKQDGFITKDSQVKKVANSLRNRVHFTGYITDEMLQQYVAHAEAMVFPSLYEGFGLPPIEAMAAGCPVLASNAASIPEVCGKYAEYFNPLDVKDIAKNLLVYNRDRYNAEELKKHASKYSWETTSKKMIELIESSTTLKSVAY